MSDVLRTPTLTPGLPEPLLDAFALDPDFLRWRAPWVLVLWAASFAVEFAVLAAGRTSSATRRVSLAIDACWLALMTWCLVAGPVFEAPAADGVVRLCLVGIMAVVVIDLVALVPNVGVLQRVDVVDVIAFVPFIALVDLIDLVKLVDLIEASDGPGAEVHWRKHMEQVRPYVFRGYDNATVLDLHQ